MVKIDVDYITLLIGAEGAQTPVGERGWGDPAGAKRRGGSPDRREPLAPRAEINNQV